MLFASLLFLLAAENCNNSHFLSQSGECVEHCPDGEYEVGEEEFGRECKKCPNDFNKCLTATYASECTNNLMLSFDFAITESCNVLYISLVTC